MRCSSLGSKIGRWGRTGIAAVSIALAASTATAQPGGGFGGENYRSSLNDAEMDRMILELKLDETQTSLVDSLYDGFSDSYQESSDESRQKMRDAFQEMRDSGDWQSAASTGIKFARDWQRQSQALEQSFFNDVKSVLTKDQLAQWPQYERNWRRRNLLRTGGQPGALAGENIDLYQIVDQVELADDEQLAVDPVLEAYASELDPALITRDRAMTDMTAATTSLMDGKMTTEELESKFKNLQRTHVQIRDMNDRYVQLLVAHLSPEKGAALQKEYLQLGYRGIYSPTRADSYLESVRKNGDLNDAQLQAIDAIEQDFQGQTSAINHQLADLQKKRELDDQQQIFQRLTQMAQGGFGPGQRGGGRANFGGGPGGAAGGAPDPRAQLMQQKNDLVESTLTSVAALLSPEQLAAVPKPEANQRGGRGVNWGNMTDEERQQMRERFQQGGGGGRGGRGGGGGG